MAPVNRHGFNDLLHSRMFPKQRRMWLLIQPVHHFGFQQPDNQSHSGYHFLTWDRKGTNKQTNMYLYMLPLVTKETRVYIHNTAIYMNTKKTLKVNPDSFASLTHFKFVFPNGFQIFRPLLRKKGITPHVFFWWENKSVKFRLSPKFICSLNQALILFGGRPNHVARITRAKSTLGGYAAHHGQTDTSIHFYRSHKKVKKA